jgi:hypothetical protein
MVYNEGCQKLSNAYEASFLQKLSVANKPVDVVRYFLLL